MALRQHSLILAGHFSLHFSARFSFAELFVPPTSATTARVLDTSSSVATDADLLITCLAIGPDCDGTLPSADIGLDVALVDATLLDLPNNWSGLNRFWYNRSEITVFIVQALSIKFNPVPDWWAEKVSLLPPKKKNDRRHFPKLKKTIKNLSSF